MPESKRQIVKKLRRENERLKASLNAARREQESYNRYRTYGPDRDVHAARLVVLDDIIGSPRRLRAVTLCSAEQFDYILHRYENWAKEHGKLPLFWDDAGRESDPGNRCRLYMRHALLLALMHKKSGPTQDELGAMFGVDQSNVNRSLAVSNTILSEILPTARKMTELLRKIDNLKDLKKTILQPHLQTAGSPSCWTARMCPSTGPATRSSGRPTIPARRRGSRSTPT